MRRHSPFTVLIATSLVVVLGCQSATRSPTSSAPTSPGALSPSSAGQELPPLADVPFYRGDPAAGAIHPGPGPATKPDVAWRVNLGRTHMVPILVDERLIVGTEEGRLVAVDGRTGKQEWTFSASGPFETLPAAANGLVYASDGSALHAIEVATGTERWSTPVDGVGGRVNVVDGVAYVGTMGGVVGMDAAGGDVVWHWDGPQNVAVLAGPIVDGIGYFAARDGRVYAVDTRSGEGVWSVQTISLDIATSAVVGDTVYVGTNQGEATEPVGELYAIDRVSGDIRWRFRAPSGLQLNAGPVRDGVLYASGRRDGIYAIRDNKSTATVMWHVDSPESHWPMALVDQTLYQVRTDGSAAAYAIGDGKLLWETEPEGDWAGGPIVSGGIVFLTNDSKGVMALADPGLIGLLPAPAAQAPPSATVSLSPVPNPFTIVQAFSWEKTGIGVPLGMESGPDGLLYILDTKPQVTVVDPDDGTAIRRWGRQGAGPGELDVTRPDDNPGFGDIAVAPDGHVYIADGSNHRVQVFAPDGEFLSQFGSFGSADGQFGAISEIAIAPDGSVYVNDGPISKFTADGEFAWRVPNSEGAIGLAVRADGVVLGTCEGCRQLLVMDPADGHILERKEVSGIDAGGFGPLNLDPDGNIYISVYGSASQMVFDANGKLVGADYLEPTEEMTRLAKTITWADTWFPSPVFLPDGRAFTFGRDGLIELKVTLPSN